MNDGISFSRSAINSAGKTIVQFQQQSKQSSITLEDYQDAIHRMQLWREQFLHPVEIAFSHLVADTDESMGATRRSRSMFVSSFRLKRETSIIEKLSRQHSHYKLSELDDIGGCRLIVNNMDDLHKVVQRLVQDPVFGGTRAKTKDYIQNPSASGYRSFHYLTRITIPDNNHTYRIEIQIRTYLQHYWATALETFSEISGLNLKDPEIVDKQRRDARRDLVKRYLHCFANIAELFALKEGTNHIPQTLEKSSCVKKEILKDPVFRDIVYQLKVAGKNVSDLSQNVDESTHKYQLFLLNFYPDEQMTNIKGFNDIESAFEAYNNSSPFIKKTSDRESTVNSVLAYASSLKGLGKAFPNYRLDQSEFLHALADVGLIDDTEV